MWCIAVGDENLNFAQWLSSVNQRLEFMPNLVTFAGNDFLMVEFKIFTVSWLHSIHKYKNR